MKKSTKTIIVITIILVVIILMYFVFFSKTTDVKQTLTKVISGKKTTSKTNTNTNVTSIPTVFPLQNGSSGTEVTNLQLYLNTLIPSPIAGLTVDGNFGANTQKYLYACSGLNSVDSDTYIKILHDLNKTGIVGDLFVPPYLNWAYDASKMTL